MYDVLQAADIFLLPDLKRQCGSFLEQYLDISNAVDLVHTARLFVLPRLEHASVEFIAKVRNNLIQGYSIPFLKKISSQYSIT